MSELEWNYIAIVYENNSYGLHGANSLQTELYKRGICIRYSSSFNTTYGVELSTLSQIIKDITLPKGGAVSGIVFFGGQSSAEKFLTAMADRSHYHMHVIALKFSSLRLRLTRIIANPPRDPVRTILIRAWTSAWM